MRRWVAAVLLVGSGCGLLEDVAAEATQDVGTRDIERLAAQTRAAQGRFEAERSEGVAAMPEVQWFAVEEKLTTEIYDYFPQHFACVAMDTWSTCDPDEALAHLVPNLKLMSREGMRDEDWARLTTLCTHCEFSSEELDRAAPLTVQRDRWGGLTVTYATHEIIGFNPAIIVHRDVIASDGSVKRTEEPFPRPVPPEPTPPGPNKREVDKGVQRLAGAFNACAEEHGGIDGTRIVLEFSISEGGEVTAAEALAPHGKTPMGRCVAETLVSKGRVKASGRAYEGVKRTVTLHPRSP